MVELFREHEHLRAPVRGGARRTGTGSLMLLVAVEEISKVCATTRARSSPCRSSVRSAIKLAGTDEQKQRCLPRLASGRVARRLRADRAGLGLGLGRDAHRGAARDGDEYVLNGSKRFITNAGVAGLYIVFAKTDPTPGTRGISAFVVEADAPGFEVGRIEPKMGIKGSTTGEIFFNDCRIPAENLLGEEGEGFKIAMRILDRSRPGVGAQGLGIAQGATDYALEYAKARETMGKPIASTSSIAGEARRHGDEVRGRARAALQGRADDRRGRARS